MKFAVLIEQGIESFEYEVNAKDSAEAEALAFRAHNEGRAWSDRACVVSSENRGGPEHEAKKDINDGKHGAKLTKKLRR